METTKCPFSSLIECVNRHRKEFETVKTPLAEHEAKIAKVRLDFKHARSSLLHAESQNPDPEGGDERILELAMECGRELEKLDYNFKAARELEEMQYARATAPIRKALCIEVVQLLGVALVRECLQHLDEAQDNQQQERFTPERDIALQGQPTQSHAANLSKSLSRKRRAVDRHIKIPSKRNKLAAQQSRKVDGEPIKLRQAILRPARNRNRQSERHARASNGASADRHHESLKPMVPGRIYRTFYKSWCLALLLPTQNLEAVGVPETMETLGLTKNIPECYVYDSESQTFSWQRLYEDGGELESKRSYPVMYFDGAEFPGRASVGWVEADNLQEYDMTGPRGLTEHHKQAELYLEQMKSSHLDQNSPLRERDSQFSFDSPQNNEATHRQRSSSHELAVVEGHAAMEQDQASTSTGEVIDGVSTAKQAARDIHEDSNSSPITGDRISLDRETTHEVDEHLHYNSMPGSPGYEPDTAHAVSASGGSPGICRVSDNSPRGFSPRYSDQEFQSDGVILVRNGIGNELARLPPTTAHSSFRIQPAPLNSDLVRQTTGLKGSIASETATPSHQQMLGRFPPPPTNCAPGETSDLRLPPIQNVWASMLPMHPQLSSCPAPAPVPAAITKAHYQTSAHPVYRKLLPHSSFSGRRVLASTHGWPRPKAEHVFQR
ncbi:hypothetical protein VFPPC_11620 [Pochonia chlamydosporia 170]|uniref:Uncharacterized protein n=1 Tax=Pochonia chlamydosporia 170 TaxID=1380566 RepID=A0A179FW17_METCM|nr:hypothetical protein VFPPC_11620 [Pochonia chlamydosporia 170]OAQ69273.1 hypothetical protein VFPPC_11620 [Pochonia chlamydosporia 170]